MTTKIVLVGGFLGAGKTTLLCRLVEVMRESGRRAAFITNDQAPELVDTILIKNISSSVGEISGSCFCCNFNGFVGAAKKLIEEFQPEVIFAEPVGSCTDLSATIMQPLKDLYGREMAAAPLSVLCDPRRLRKVLEKSCVDIHPSAAYIIEKQLEEADLILISKSDTVTAGELSSLMDDASARWPLAKVMATSARNGRGVTEWLSETLAAKAAGTHIADIDYDRYAEGEAALGWLNAKVRLRGGGIRWDDFTERLTSSLSGHFDARGSAVGHIKLIVRCGGHVTVANVTGGIETLTRRGSAGCGDSAEMTVNARVETTPQELEKAVREKLAEACGKDIAADVVDILSLQPGRPNPTHRYEEVIA
ncbi:GTP-binding protein [Cloacibacillus porcorum]